MKAADVLGLDEDWQNEQIQILKDKNKQRVAELQDKKKNAEQDALAADEYDAAMHWAHSQTFPGNSPSGWSLLYKAPYRETKD